MVMVSIGRSVRVIGLVTRWRSVPVAGRVWQLLFTFAPEALAQWDR